MITDQTIARIRRFSDERDWHQFHTPANLAKSIAIEAAELLECFQWDEENFDLKHTAEELADVMNYCLQMCDRLDLDPDAILNEKCTQNEEKYPVDQAKGSAEKYTVYIRQKASKVQ